MTECKIRIKDYYAITQSLRYTSYYEDIVFNYNISIEHIGTL